MVMERYPATLFATWIAVEVVLAIVDPFLAVIGVVALAVVALVWVLGSMVIAEWKGRR